VGLVCPSVRSYGSFVQQLTFLAAVPSLWQWPFQSFVDDLTKKLMIPWRISIAVLECLSFFMVSKIPRVIICMMSTCYQLPLEWCFGFHTLSMVLVDIIHRSGNSRHRDTSQTFNVEVIHACWGLVLQSSVNTIVLEPA
jgi:hypothetical protein